ncbi:type IA DNA topoisomerase [Bifidobacterium xylocopae]|uniref:DNA topoisomerase n=1 Tax=Bifidobacterium xylocopae TaxID=2493119 RepID=A0A366KAP1_9BIFI|nr:type IA DNA topoisomerase [Bifidobacterium xylocopae]RBP98805.1 DNA topoisomerase III [Bifidobacterium xylocopae]
MRLIIAEKRSVASAIGKAIGGDVARRGYIEAGDSLITWAQGHLVELAEPGEYKDRPWSAKRWNLETLPIDPGEAWIWSVNHDKTATERYNCIVSLASRPDVDTVINACDPDREGEAIFRRIMFRADVRKPMQRLWVASMEGTAIRSALKDMRPDSEYQGLADAAEIRAKADWLTGMNASRAYTLLYKRPVRVGRVQTPTLSIIVDRDRQIEQHVPRPFWRVRAGMGSWTLTSEPLYSPKRAQEVAHQVDTVGVNVREVKRLRRRLSPPHLYDLTELQKDMNRLHGFTAEQTADAAQRLYENELINYPRTDSTFITRAELPKLTGFINATRAAGVVATVPPAPRLRLIRKNGQVDELPATNPTASVDSAVIERLRLHGFTAEQTADAAQRLYQNELINYPRTDSTFITRAELPKLTGVINATRAAGVVATVPPAPRFNLVVDDTRVEGHPAILPTASFDSAAIERLGDDERLVWVRIVQRVCEAVGDDYVHDTVDVAADTGGVRFTCSADTPVSWGWKGVAAKADHEGGDESEHNDIPTNLIAPAVLPALDTVVVSGKSKPPSPMTDADLLTAMQSASRYLKDKALRKAMDDERSHSGGIGTPATRAKIIERLVKTRYAEREGNYIRSTELGRTVIDLVAEDLRDVELTARMEQRLSAVEHGEADAAEVMEEMRAQAVAIPATAKSDLKPELIHIREAYGSCPRCGKTVVKTGKVWQCSSNQSVKDSSGEWRLTAGCGWKLFGSVAGKGLSDEQAKALLAGRMVPVSGLKSRSTSHLYDAWLTIDADRGFQVHPRREQR